MHDWRSCVGLAFGIGDRVEHRRGHYVEGWASGDRQSAIRCVALGCNFGLILLQIGREINKIETFYINIYKVHFIF